MIRSIYSSLKGGISLWDPQESSHLYLCHFATLSCPQSVSYRTSQQAKCKNTPSAVGIVYGKLPWQRFVVLNVNQPLQPFSYCSCGSGVSSFETKCYKLKANSNMKNKTGVVSFFLYRSLRYKEDPTVLFLLTCFLKKGVSFCSSKKIRSVRLNQIPISSIRAGRAWVCFGESYCLIP